MVSALFFTGIAVAADEDNPQSKASSDDEESNSSLLSNVESIVDDTRNRVSNRFSSFVTQVDNYLGDEEATGTPNKSWARVRIDTVKPGGESLELKGTVKLRVVLPKSQERFRLLLSTEDEDVTASNSDAAERERIAAEGDGDVSLALRFIRTAKNNNVTLNYDLGARVRDDRAEIFGRINAAYRHDWIWGFRNRLTNNFFYFSSSGYENRISYDIRRIFFDRESVYFRNSTEVSWREGLSGAGIGETIGFYADLGTRKAIALEAITGYTTSLNNGQTDRFRGVEARIRFRHSVWRPWFYYEIWPSVSWSASNNYEQAYGGLIRLEVPFGN